MVSIDGYKHTQVHTQLSHHKVFWSVYKSLTWSKNTSNVCIPPEIFVPSGNDQALNASDDVTNSP